MSNFMKTLATILLVIMVIGSFVLGNTFKIVTYQSAYWTETQYNAGVMLAGLLTSAITFGILYSIGAALEKMDILSEQLQRIKEAGDSCSARLDLLRDLQMASAASAEEAPPSTENIFTPAQVSVETTDLDECPTFVVDKDSPSVSCPRCNCAQRSSRSKCFSCGAKFISAGEAETSA